MKAKSARAPRTRKEPSLQEGAASLSEGEKLAWLRLIRTPLIGVITFWELLSHFGSASAAIEALPEFAKFGSRVTARTIPTVAAAGAELKRAAAAGMPRMRRAIRRFFPRSKRRRRCFTRRGNPVSGSGRRLRSWDPEMLQRQA